MIKKVLLLVKDSFTESYRINLDQTGFLLVKDSFTENYRINLDQTGSFTRQRFFNRKLSKKSWSKSFFYKKLSMKFWSNMSYCFIQSQFLLKFDEKKNYFFGFLFNNNFLTWLLSTCYADARWQRPLVSYCKPKP